MKKTALISAVLSAVLGVFLIKGYINKIELQSALDSNLRDVIIAKKYIPKYSLITLDLVNVVQIPAKYIQPKSMSSPKEILNQAGKPQFISLVPIMEGESVLRTKLMLPNSETGLAVVVPVGQRAVSIPVRDDIASSGLVKPGNKVDLIGTLNQKAVYLMQNLLILSVGNQVIGEVQKKERSSLLSEITPGYNANIITLAVTPKQALKISLAKKKCDFSLALRNSIDGSTNQIISIYEHELSDTLGSPGNRVQIIRGSGEE